MYLGLVLGVLGWAVLLGSLVPFAVVPGLFVLIHFRFVEREEPFMAERTNAECDCCRAALIALSNCGLSTGGCKADTPVQLLLHECRCDSWAGFEPATFRL